MKKTHQLFLYLLLFGLVGLVRTGSAKKLSIDQLKFSELSSTNHLPSKDVQMVFQDRNGFIWFSTRFGLCQYDGYELKVYKSDYKSPDLLTSNNIQCLAEDARNHIYIGTQNGFNILDKTTGTVKKVMIPVIDNNYISSILVTKKGVVWIGTDSGLCRYDPLTGKIVVYSNNETNNVLTTTSIKSLIEDSDGDIWIGTWSKGLYRYSPKTNQFYAYPKFNDRNSAFYVFEDSRKNIWVGTWSEGLFLLKHPKNMKEVSWTCYKNQAGNPESLADNVIYCITEDPQAHVLCIGTRGGFSLMDLNTPGKFTTFFPGSKAHFFPANEVNSVLYDRTGSMWIGTIGYGVYRAKTFAPKFSLNHIVSADERISTGSVRRIFVDDENRLWLSLGSEGAFCFDRNTTNLTNCLKLPEFRGFSHLPTVNAIIQKKQTHEIWFGTHDEGIYVYKKGLQVRNLTPDNTSFIKDFYINALLEDSRNNTWIGTRYGLGLLRPNGKGTVLNLSRDGNENLSNFFVNTIVEGAPHEVWVGSANSGILRVFDKPAGITIRHYSKENGRLKTNAILCMYKDTRNRIWTGTEGGGLYIYRPDKDCFEEKINQYKLPCDVISSIEEDEMGHLWLGTNMGLICLNLSADLQKASYRIFTTEDGLQDNYFLQRSSFRSGNQLFFGGGHGLNSFYPSQIVDEKMRAPIVITDIKFFNKSFSELDLKDQKRLSEKSPTYADRIVIPHKLNNFTIEFAALTFLNPELNRYAYKLEGFDKEWRYTTASRRFANYNNLSRGTYTFLLRASNENGTWGNEVKQLKITILPPFWASWWAFLLYAAILTCLSWLILRELRNRILIRNKLRYEEIERSKADELNHAKLNFFTNITHELMTPLTILSASVDELKLSAPEFAHTYAVMGVNINRLIRLLQQILEFRKVESGNTKLRVSLGDIAEFVNKEIESFKPLIKKKKLHVSVVCDPDKIAGYFDQDKLDKILYNLLSNASKYNKEGGFIHIDLKYNRTTGFITLTVEDNGIGISENDQKNLFTRFYEGTNRPLNTPGTGIGLSLTKDLVLLHKGTIRVDSEKDKGTMFVIELPVGRSFYSEKEMDESLNSLDEPVCKEVDNGMALRPEEKVAKEKPYTLMVVEDDELLRNLMIQLLSHDYNVLQAEDGCQAMQMVGENDVDLIVTDLMMPRMNGIDLCKQIKTNFDYSHIPVILLTAKNSEEDKTSAYEAGADGFIAKPFSLSVLHARIKNLLQKKELNANGFKNQHAIEIKDLNYTTNDELFLQKAIQAVQKHLDDPEFGQLQFVDEMNCSKSTLYKKIKFLTGLNTSAFICNIRLKTACKIIEEKKSIMISELAYAVGFSTPKYFSYCFKKEFGMLPSEYIERYEPGTRIKEETASEQ